MVEFGWNIAQAWKTGLVILRYIIMNAILVSDTPIYEFICMLVPRKMERDSGSSVFMLVCLHVDEMHIPIYARTLTHLVTYGVCVYV